MKYSPKKKLITDLPDEEPISDDNEETFRRIKKNASHT